MRVSNNWLQQQNVNLMTQQQTKLSQTQMKIASGQKFLTPAEDPNAASQNLGFNQAIDETTQYQENVTTAQYRLNTEDKVLSGVVDTIQRLKDLGLQGITDLGNASLNRNALAAEFDQLNEHLLGLANTKNANGEYLFAGFKTNTPPYQPVAGSTTVPFYEFVGTADQRSIQIGQTRQITEGDSASTIFGATTATNGNSIFDTVRLFSDQLKSDIGDTISGSLGTATKNYSVPAAGGDFNVKYDLGNRPSKIDIYVNDQLKQSVVPTNGAGESGVVSVAGADIPAGSTVKVVIAGDTNSPWTANISHISNPDLTTLNQLDEFLTQTTNIRSSVGARLNALDNQQATNDNFILNMKTILSQNADLNYADAVTQMNQQQNSLQAAQQSFTKVQGLSLFKYL